MENLNLFIRSIFIDNMIFAYFLGMCSYLAVSKNVKTAFGLGIAVTFMLVITLPIDYALEMYFLRPGALSWLSPEFANVDLSFLSLVLYISSSYSSKLRNSWLLALYAAEKFRLSTYSYYLRSRFWFWLAFGHCWDSGDSRTFSLFKCPSPIKRYRYHIYNHRTYGYCFHEFLGYQNLVHYVL